jgi:predicted nucleotidyltransferase
MRRAEALAILQAHRDELRQRHVTSLALFGSVARDEAGPKSDVDLLVEFDAPVGYFGLVQLERYLAELLDSQVDLGTFAMLRDQLRQPVEQDMIRVA